MSVKFQRPAAGYAGQGSGANRTKYQDDAGATPKRAISSAKMDGDLNYLIDAVNETWGVVTQSSFTSVLPDQAGNAGKVPVTNGAQTNWQLIGAANVADKALPLGKLADGAPGRLLGTGSNGTVGEIQPGGGLSLSGGVLTVTGGLIPAGVLTPFAGLVIPAGWLLCAGQAVNRVDYAALFAVVGTTYGAGNGNTTFGLPDLRGRAVLGLDNMDGVGAGRVSAGTVLGGSGGAQTKNTGGTALTVAQLPAHSHGQQISGGKAVVQVGAAGPTVTGSGPSSTPNQTYPQELTAATGNGATHDHTVDVLPPYLLLNWLIKA